MSAENNLIIEDNTVVSFHYRLSDESKSVVESSFDDEPLVYLHGYQQIIPGLERALTGRKKGDQFSLNVGYEDGYGPFNEDLLVVLEKNQFADQSKLELGSFFHFASDEGDELVVRVVDITDEKVTIDGNHMFAGKNLSFEIEVLDVRAATPEEIEHGHAHGPGGHAH